MRVLNIDSVPNQSSSYTLDGNRWDIVLKECNGVMCMTISINDNLLLSGQRVVYGSPVIPYKHMQAYGNLWFLCENDELPNYQSFGTTQQLIYVSSGEVLQ